MAQVDILGLTEDTAPAADDVYESQKAAGGAGSSKKVKQENVGIPGFYTQLGKGPTSIADNTTVVVLSGQTLAAGEIPIFHFGMKSTPTNVQRHLRIKLADVDLNVSTGFAAKQTSGDWNFIVRHNDGAARDFDWQALKVASV